LDLKDIFPKKKEKRLRGKEKKNRKG